MADHELRHRPKCNRRAKNPQEAPGSGLTCRHVMIGDGRCGWCGEVLDQELAQQSAMEDRLSARIERDGEP